MIGKIIFGIGINLLQQYMVAAATPPQKPIQKIFFQHAWHQYAEGVAQDLEDPSIISTQLDTFRTEVYKAVGQDVPSFNHIYVHTTVDDSSCANMQATVYEGTFEIDRLAENEIAVSFEDIRVYVTTAQHEGCAPAL